MSRPSLYPRELRERAVRLVAEVRPNYEAEYAAIGAVAHKLGIATAETLRKWVRAQVDAGERPGVSTDESVEVKRIKRLPRSPATGLSGLWTCVTHRSSGRT